ncbi:MAG TPA: hypothetical protein DCS07_01735 [Bdellovibrionales bacterium]|nr:MAG: hypothetical protein A2Z97_15360 [Bdellovibrionales bacterium GWB1_52_6]OFZ03952.1 MAG: hypothetical protein A2X97_08450 [Bdellovibrionales bacterium GWA1_52_35]OFZ37648.1 MAG: hypothetical protein A2070_00690 [Bdellovibrionales bacterium GWC1_52_8]HAR41345.1 hypothetical protein [Bdellovibrionales bacterium]HCM39765.1 hypothetical protein [Bdellovibrionales bacterium]
MTENPNLATDLVAVDIKDFRNATRDINFDVFLKLSEGNYAHVFSRTTGLDYKRLAQYVVKGVTHLYVKNADFEQYKNFISISAHSIFTNPNTPQEKKISTLLNMTEQNMSEVFVQIEIDEDTASKTQRVIQNYVELVAADPQMLAVILKLVSHGEYLYYHAIAVSIFSMFIAKASGQFNQRTLELLGLGGFLHDIGYTQLPPELMSYAGELTQEQKHVVRTHAHLGLNMLQNTKNIPDEVRYIVYQHHEEPSGAGYPNGLNSAVIYYPAKIVALADGFSALISKRPYRPPFSVPQAVKILQDAGRKYDRELVKVVATVFLPRAK